MNDQVTAGGDAGGESSGFGPTLSAEEEAFFSSGGEAGISDTGSDPAGDDGSGSPDGGNNSAGKDGKGGNDGKGEPKFVPLSALQEERGKRKADRALIDELRGKVSNFEGKFSVLDRLNQKPAGEDDNKAPVVPSIEEDIFAVVRHQGETIAQMNKRLEDEKAATTKQAEEAATEATFVNNYMADAAAFEAKPETSDYKQAYNFLLETRAKELKAIGYDDPVALQAAGAAPEEIHAAAKALHDALVADERGIAQLAFSKKKSPAEIIYNLAKQRGYKKADGKAPAPSKGAEKLDTIERGQQVNKSLNGAGGSEAGDEMTAERLLAMPLDEFEKWTETNPAKARRILGG